MSIRLFIDIFILVFNFKNTSLHAKGERWKEYHYWQPEIIITPNFLPISLHANFQELSPVFSLPHILLALLYFVHCQWINLRKKERTFWSVSTSQSKLVISVMLFFIEKQWFLKFIKTWILTIKKCFLFCIGLTNWGNSIFSSNECPVEQWKQP